MPRSPLFFTAVLIVFQAYSQAFQLTPPFFRNSFLTFKYHPFPSVPSSIILQSLLRDDSYDSFLSYLSSKGEDLPPDMKEIVIEATTQHTSDSRNDDLGSIQHLLDVIDYEYKVSDRPVIIQNVTYSMPSIYRILSVCLFHQLPACIVCKLLEPVQSGNGPLSICQQAFKTEGWRAVSFPDGMRVQVRPGQICSTWKDYLPPRKVTKDMAAQLIEQAEKVEPPRKIRTSSILKALEEEFSFPSSTPNLATSPLPCFPGDKNSVMRRLRRTFSQQIERFRRATQRQAEMLNRAGRAGFLAYGFLNLAVYAGGTLWQWNRVPGGSTLQSQIQKLGKVLGSVYIGSQVTKLPRIILAVAFAPLGNRSLEWLQIKLGVSEGIAFAIFCAGIIATFLGVLASLTLGSAVIA